MGAKKKITKDMITPGYDRDGRKIDLAYIREFEGVKVGCIMDFFEEGSLDEASKSFEDFSQEGDMHIIYALERWSTHDCINQVGEYDDEDKTMSDADRLSFKASKANDAEFITQQKERWVRRKLKSEFRRAKYEASFKVKHGSTETVGWAEVVAVCTTPEKYSFSADQVSLVQAHEDYAKMRDIEDSEGMAAAVAWFKSLDQERQENLVKHLHLAVGKDSSVQMFKLIDHENSNEE